MCVCVCVYVYIIYFSIQTIVSSWFIIKFDLYL